MRVLSDILTAANAQLFSLLDLSVAFCCMDHQLLMPDFGVTDIVIAWMISFVIGRSQQVMGNLYSMTV